MDGGDDGRCTELCAVYTGSRTSVEKACQLAGFLTKQTGIITPQLPNRRTREVQNVDLFRVGLEMLICRPKRDFLNLAGLVKGEGSTARRAF